MRRTVVFPLVLWAAVAGLATATAAPAAARHRAAAVTDPCAGLTRSDLKACKADQAKSGRDRAAAEDPCAGLARSDLRACRADQARSDRGHAVEAARGDPCAKVSRRGRAACEREVEAADQAEARRAPGRSRQTAETASARAAKPGSAKHEIQPDDLIGGVEPSAPAPSPGAAPALRGSLSADVSVPVADATSRAAPRAPHRAAHLHEVVLEDGQSLADLAASTGVSVADLAKLNGVSSVDDVPTGMKLKLPAGAKTATPRLAAAPPSAPEPAAPAPVEVASAPPTQAPPPSRGSRAERRSASAGPSTGPHTYASLGPEGSAPAPSAPTTVRGGRTQADALAAYAVASARAPRVADRPEATHERFVWPLRAAEVVSGFGAHGLGQRNDGVDLAARPGDAVRASAAGEVVYAGKEIAAAGGNLVLLKHADGWVTAYSHLGRLTVGMRQTVDQGQEIAETADVAGASVHFEVRQPGAGGAKPVDPVTVLPTRGGGDTGRG